LSDTSTAIADKLSTVIDAIRPAIQADGGDIVLHGMDDDGVVTVELLGACVSCPASTLTLKAGVERILKDRVEGVTAVRDVNDGVDELDGTPVSL
jgi:Fe-S cluster biogenesis protein NfuA